MKQSIWQLRLRLFRFWEQSRVLGFAMGWAAWLFRAAARWRRHMQSRDAVRLSVPVVVVGNLHLGGSGKTPLVLALAKILRDAGYRPGIVSRGWGGTLRSACHRVQMEDTPAQVGDEALLHVRAAPTAVGRDRPRAAQMLIEEACDVILSDDGLQHYRLARDVEIAVIDGMRGLGNGYCLPAGPLREPEKRLREVDFVVCNGVVSPPLSAEKMQLRALELSRLDRRERRALHPWPLPAKVHGVAGIGAPERFFALLRSLAVQQVLEHPFPDHYAYRPGELCFADTAPVLMTEKDAVKCRLLPECKAAPERYWVLDVCAELEDDFKQRFLQCLAHCFAVRQSAEVTV